MRTHLRLHRCGRRHQGCAGGQTTAEQQRAPTLIGCDTIVRDFALTTGGNAHRWPFERVDWHRCLDRQRSCPRACPPRAEATSSSTSASENEQSCAQVEQAIRPA